MLGGIPTLRMEGQWNSRGPSTWVPPTVTHAKPEELEVSFADMVKHTDPSIKNCSDESCVQKRVDTMWAREVNKRRGAATIGPTGGTSKEEEDDLFLSHGMRSIAAQEDWFSHTVIPGEISTNGYGRWYDGKGKYFTTRTKFSPYQVDQMKTIDTSTPLLNDDGKPACGEEGGFHAALHCLDMVNMTYKEQDNITDFGAYREQSSMTPSPFFNTIDGVFPKGLANKKHDNWFGPNADGSDVVRHEYRMRSGIYHAGDHGEPTGALKLAMDAADTLGMVLPLVSTGAHAAEGIAEARVGNDHAQTAFNDMYKSAAFDVGGFAVGAVAGPAIGAAGRVARGAGRSVMTTTERMLVANAERFGSVRSLRHLPSDDVQAVAHGGAEHLGAPALTATESGAVVSTADTAAVATKEVAATVNAEEAATATAAASREADRLAVQVAERDAAAAAVVEEAEQGLPKRIAKNLAREEKKALRHHHHHHKRDLGEEMVTGGAIDVGIGGALLVHDGGQMYTEDSTEPVPLPIDTSNGDRTAPHTTPYQREGHTAEEDHHERLSERVRPRQLVSTEESIHPHQVGDSSNMYLIGALVLGGAGLVYAVA